MGVWPLWGGGYGLGGMAQVGGCDLGIGLHPGGGCGLVGGGGIALVGDLAGVGVKACGGVASVGRSR